MLNFVAFVCFSVEVHIKSLLVIVFILLDYAEEF